jgi:hypothetical protein
MFVFDKLLLAGHIAAPHLLLQQLLTLFQVLYPSVILGADRL